jgi:hypothetical protein
VASVNEIEDVAGGHHRGRPERPVPGMRCGPPAGVARLSDSVIGGWILRALWSVGTAHHYAVGSAGMK